MLFTPPTLDATEEAVVSRIDEVRKTLTYAVASKRWTAVMARMTLARSMRGSIGIEGYNVTLDDAMAVADSQEPTDVNDETRAALVGYQSAMTYVLLLSDDPNFAYSRGLIKSLHFMMQQYDFTKNPGRWRPGPVFVRNEPTGERVYEGPSASLVNGLAHELVEFLNKPPEGIHPMVLAAMAHLNLVMIHPFSDGNGRMSRVLQTLVLARSGILAKEFCSLEEYLGRNRQSYYDVLAEVGTASWHPGRDARPWIRYCLKAHFQQASTLLIRANVIENLWDVLEHEVATRGLPERVIPALGEAALGLKIRNATYRKSAGLSDHVAGRDLKLLCDIGLLVPKGEKRGRRYVASETLLAIGHEAARGEKRQIEDPFVLAADYLPGLAHLP
jgi:Fic family protein